MKNIPALLEREVSELLNFLSDPKRNDPDQYEVIETRLNCLKFATQIIEQQNTNSDDLRNLQEWFRTETNPIFSLSNTCKRARIWPEGYPGDFRTLEALYSNKPVGQGLAAHLDRYTLSRTLAIALRSRLRKLIELLQECADSDSNTQNWLNLACGPCRELLSITLKEFNRISVYCVDTDSNALEYARTLINGNRFKANYIKENAFRFVNADRNIRRFGYFSTIYSAGFFDYVPSDRLVKLIKALYESLRSGGILIAPFKEKNYYEMFDYHWYTNWYHFLQRSENEFRHIFKEAGISDDAISMERDESGVILFFTIRR